MIVAGTLSGLLGIGSGAAKVLAMDQNVIPFKVSTTTSNFMIGVTAAASAGIYYRAAAILIRASVLPYARGVGWSLVGAKVLVRTRTKWLRILFGLVLLAFERSDDIQRHYRKNMRKPSAKKWDDSRIEIVMANLLRFGVVLAATVVAIGAFRYLFNHGLEKPHYAIFRGNPPICGRSRGFWRT